MSNSAENKNGSIVSWLKKNAKDVTYVITILTGGGFIAQDKLSEDETVNQAVVNRMNDIDSDVILNNDFREWFYDREDSPEYKATNRKAIESDQMVKIHTDAIIELKGDVKELEKEVHARH